MLKQLTLLMAVATLAVSCKKDKAQVEHELFIGSWQAMIQLQTGGHWPLMNADSVRAAGNFCYEFKSNHTAIFKRVIIPANTPMSPDLLLRWKPGMPVGNVYTTPLSGGVLRPFPTETVTGYWDYNKYKKELRVIGSQRQTLETWHLEVIQDRQLITPVLALSLSRNIRGVSIRQNIRFVFIKK